MGADDRFATRSRVVAMANKHVATPHFHSLHWHVTTDCNASERVKTGSNPCTSDKNLVSFAPVTPF